MRARLGKLGLWCEDGVRWRCGGCACARAAIRCRADHINVPNLNGLEILRAVRERDRDIPVVLMTGGPGLDSARVAVEWGALSYLIKPLSNVPASGRAFTRGAMHRVARRERRILHCTEEHETRVGGDAASFRPALGWDVDRLSADRLMVKQERGGLRSPHAHDLRRTVLAPGDSQDAEALDQMPTLGRKTRGQVAE